MSNYYNYNGHGYKKQNKGFGKKKIMGNIGWTLAEAVLEAIVTTGFDYLNEKQKQKWDDLHIHDKKLDITYELVRPMTEGEKKVFNKYVNKKGYSVGEVLETMKLI